MITLEIKTYNKQGVLEKLSGLLRRKLYNIEFIHAEPSKIDSHITDILIKITGPNETKADNLIKHIEKIVEVVNAKLINEKTN